MKRIYCISGLGADRRLFKNIDIPGYQLVHLPWVEHLHTDSLATYAEKMSALINEHTPIIIGLSMGGMIATEIGKTRPTEKIILISSAKTRDEVGQQPYLIDWAAKKGIVPTRFLNIPFPVVLNRLGATTKDEKQLLSNVITDSNPQFMKWAFKAILEWKNIDYPPNVFHIHGTDDKVIVPRNVKPDIWIEGGSHIMILNRAEKVNNLIYSHLTN